MATNLIRAFAQPGTEGQAHVCEMASREHVCSPSAGWAGLIATPADPLREGRMDIAVLFNVSGTEDYSAEPLATERLHLVGHPRDMVAFGRTVAARELRDLPLVLTPLPHGLRLLLDRWSNDAGIALNTRFELNAPSALMRMAGEGICYTIVSRAAAQDEVRAGRLATSEIIDPPIKRLACLCESRRRPSDPARAAVLDLARATALRLANDGIWPATVRSRESR
jgi:LysR family nitrogen assimilation transcriptional regulator